MNLFDFYSHRFIKWRSLTLFAEMSSAAATETEKMHQIFKLMHQTIKLAN